MIAERFDCSFSYLVCNYVVRLPGEETSSGTYVLWCREAIRWVLPLKCTAITLAYSLYLMRLLRGLERQFACLSK